MAVIIIEVKSALMAAVLQTPPRESTWSVIFENEGCVTQPIGVVQKPYHGNSLTVFLFVSFFQGDKWFVGREGIPHERGRIVGAILRKPVGN